MKGHFSGIRSEISVGNEVIGIDFDVEAREWVDFSSYCSMFGIVLMLLEVGHWAKCLPNIPKSEIQIKRCQQLILDEIIMGIGRIESNTVSFFAHYPSYNAMQ